MDDGMTNEEVQFWYGRNTNTTWRCEQRLKSLCTTFHEEFPECTPAVGNRASWYAGLRKVLREFNEVGGSKFIRWAKAELSNRSPLNIVDAHSIGFLIPQFKKGETTTCPTCRQHFSMCRCEWGSMMREKKYGGEL